MRKAKKAATQPPSRMASTTPRMRPTGLSTPPNRSGSEKGTAEPPNR